MSETQTTNNVSSLTVQDITHQSLSLGRRIDRLPPGEYSIRLVKGGRLSAWRAVFWDDSGMTVSDVALGRPAHCE